MNADSRLEALLAEVDARRKRNNEIRKEKLKNRFSGQDAMKSHCNLQPTEIEQNLSASTSAPVPAQETVKSEPHNNNVVSMSDRKPVQGARRFLADEDTFRFNNLSKMNPDELSDSDLLWLINLRFETVLSVSQSAADLETNAVIIYGSPGVGKTHTVRQTMEKKKEADPDFYYEYVQGTRTKLGLFRSLFYARKGVLILDDVDNVFNDPESVQILKAAMDDCPKPIINYGGGPSELDEGIPKIFPFEGCVVILTNTDLENGSKNKIPHYKAIKDRGYYANVMLRTDREKILHIKKVLTTTNILHEHLDEEYHYEVIGLFEQFIKDFKDVSLRTMVKLAKLRANRPANWQILACDMLMRDWYDLNKK